MPAKTKADVAARPEPQPRKFVPLKDLGVAPENMRFGEPPDDGVPLLADTIHAAGLLKPLHVRPGRRREKPSMALDGRRRLLALEHNRALGRIDDDYQVEVVEETEPARQAAAVLLTNTAVPVHVADVIGAIGRMLKAKLTVDAISRALGYAEVEIKRLAALSGVHSKALDALKQGRLTLSQVRLLARLPDPELQKEVAAQALAGFGFQGWRISERLDQGRVTALDRRFALVGAARYAEAGGRVEADLFGELPDQLLDPEILNDLWNARVRTAAAVLEAEGIDVHVTQDGGGEHCDGLEPMGYVYGNALREEQLAAYESARADFGELAHQVREADLSEEDGPERIGAMLLAKLALERAGQPGRPVRAVVLWPAGRLGADSRFYAEAMAEPEERGEGGEPETGGWALPVRSRPEPVEVPALDLELDGVGHALHETRTDMATRGLIRALADDPTAALVALIARLFSTLVLDSARSPESSALSVTAAAYARAKHQPVDSLDGEVRRRLAERRAAWKASRLRPIPWIAELPHGERMGLLAELVALSLDLREAKTSALRPAARADAAEIAELTCADIAAYWTPDEAFLKVHRKKHLLAMLEAMGASDDRARSLKHEELVQFVAERAAERGWAPAEVGWSSGETEDVEGAAAAGDGISEAGPDGPVQEVDAGGEPETALATAA